MHIHEPTPNNQLYTKFVTKDLFKSNLYKREVSVDEYSGCISRAESRTHGASKTPFLVFSSFFFFLLLEKLNRSGESLDDFT